MRVAQITSPTRPRPVAAPAPPLVPSASTGRAEYVRGLLAAVGQVGGEIRAASQATRLIYEDAERYEPIALAHVAEALALLDVQVADGHRVMGTPSVMVDLADQVRSRIYHMDEHIRQDPEFAIEQLDGATDLLEPIERVALRYLDRVDVR